MEIQTSVAPFEICLREDLEKVYALLFRYVGNDTRLALCNVDWLTMREFVILMPDPIVFAPWLVLLDVGEPCDSCPDTSHEAALRGQTGKSDVYQQPIAGVRGAGVGVKVDPFLFVVLYLCCPMLSLKFTGGATLAMRWMA